MSYEENELKMIEELAGLFFKAEDIAVVLEIDPQEFSCEIKLGESEAAKVFARGWLNSERELRKSVYESAINGSNPAQLIMLEFNKNNKNA
ncbi:MAG: hypothetical protein ACOYOV_12450 [Bacteroidales bacterium]